MALDTTKTATRPFTGDEYLESLRDGREVYLCWRLGEPEVSHWHELNAGFAGRQPLTAPAAKRVRNTADATR